MPESEKEKPSGNAVPSATPFEKFQALASALVKVSPSELPADPKNHRAELLAVALVEAESELQRTFPFAGKLEEEDKKELRFNAYLEVIKLWMKG